MLGESTFLSTFQGIDYLFTVVKAKLKSLKMYNHPHKLKVNNFIYYVEPIYIIQQMLVQSVSTSQKCCAYIQKCIHQFSISIRKEVLYLFDTKLISFLRMYNKIRQVSAVLKEYCCINSTLVSTIIFDCLATEFGF